MTRQVVLDTETTGLNPKLGDRIIEVGCVEILNRQVGERHFHAYVNPEREVPAEAVEVHGLTTAFLADKPAFRAVAAEFVAFLGDARLIIHNAAFDMKFLNAELTWAGHGSLPWARAVDTLELARRRYPGAANTLDALCRRFGVDNAGRTKHGEYGAFGEQLRHDTTSSGTARQPHGNLTSPRACPRQEQARDIGARDQEHDADDGHQQEEEEAKDPRDSRVNAARDRGNQGSVAVLES